MIKAVDKSESEGPTRYLACDRPRQTLDNERRRANDIPQPVVTRRAYEVSDSTDHIQTCQTPFTDDKVAAFLRACVQCQGLLQTL